MSQKPIFTKSMNSHKWVTTIHTQHSGQIWKTGLELWIASITLKKFDTIIYLPATCRRVKHQKTDDIYCSLLLKLANWMNGLLFCNKFWQFRLQKLSSLFARHWLLQCIQLVFSPLGNMEPSFYARQSYLYKILLFLTFFFFFYELSFPDPYSILE